MPFKKTEGLQKPLFPQQSRLTHQRCYAPVLHNLLKYYPFCAYAFQVIPCTVVLIILCYLPRLCHYDKWY